MTKNELNQFTEQLIRQGKLVSKAELIKLESAYMNHIMLAEYQKLFVEKEKEKC